MMGYSSNNSIENLGSLFVFIGLRACFMLLLLVLHIMNPILVGKLRKFYLYLLKENILRAPIDLYLSAFPECLLGAVLALKFPRESELSGEVASWIVAWFNLIVCIILLPFFALLVISRRQSVVESESFQQKFGSLT